MPDREKVIKGWECHMETDPIGCADCPYRQGWRTCNFADTLFKDVYALLKEQEAKPPIHVHEEYPEHDWKTDEDGKIDEWAMSYEFHNGPMCKRCYHSFCIHCEPNGFNDGPCVIDEYKCPKCECILQKGTKFCSECGQAVKWNESKS